MEVGGTSCADMLTVRAVGGHLEYDLMGVVVSKFVNIKGFECIEGVMECKGLGKEFVPCNSNEVHVS